MNISFHHPLLRYCLNVYVHKKSSYFSAIMRGTTLLGHVATSTSYTRPSQERSPVLAISFALDNNMQGHMMLPVHPKDPLRLSVLFQALDLFMTEVFLSMGIYHIAESETCL